MPDGLPASYSQNLATTPVAETAKPHSLKPRHYTCSRDSEINRKPVSASDRLNVRCNFLTKHWQPVNAFDYQDAIFLTSSKTRQCTWSFQRRMQLSDTENPPVYLTYQRWMQPGKNLIKSLINISINILISISFNISNQHFSSPKIISANVISARIRLHFVFINHYFFLFFSSRFNHQSGLGERGLQRTKKKKTITMKNETRKHDENAEDKSEISCNKNEISG